MARHQKSTVVGVVSDAHAIAVVVIEPGRQKRNSAIRFSEWDDGLESRLSSMGTIGPRLTKRFASGKLFFHAQGGRQR